MRRTASEVLRDLEIRIARLEKQARNPREKDWADVMGDFKAVGLVEARIDGISEGLRGTKAEDSFVWFISDQEVQIQVIILESFKTGKKKIFKWFDDDYRSALKTFEKLTGGTLSSLEETISISYVKLDYPQPDWYEKPFGI
jgi:hypothetical protein